ncbi:RIO1 family regulatory kinase/ATPase [Geodermatophilus sp. SYSU D01186]
MTSDGSVGEGLRSSGGGGGTERPRVPVTGSRRPPWPAGAERRRPSGRDHDPRWQVARGVWVCAGALAVSAGLLVAWAGRTGGLPGFDRAVREFLAPTGSGPEWAADLGRLGAALGYRVLWVPTVLLLAWTARWRHLLVYVVTVSLVATTAVMAGGDARLVRVVREGVTGSPAELSLPAWPVVVLATVATGSLVALTPSGRVRRWGWAVVALGVGTLVVDRVALGLDTVSTAVASAVLGCSAAALAFQVFAPEPVFPVTWHRTGKAHLRLDEERTDKILTAVRDQLGIEVTEIRPYRLDGSAGSTPCRLRLASGPPEHLFGKLYATTHLRSDRWYKWARVLRYGRLEDEAPFASVRRLVEHEDYMLRLLRDGGVRVPEPLGVVEVVPGREYLLVTELVPEAVEVLDSGVDDTVIDDALRQVRRLWAAGAAHRDVKPSNVLAHDGRVHLVDVSFGELRPSRWRQAADLANMMLTLALVAGPRRVTERALAFFGPEELAEAFAATSSLTIPRQLARRLAEADGDLLEEFRSLLPPWPRVRVQRWSLRRVLLAVATVGGAALTAVLLAVNLRAGGLL